MHRSPSTSAFFPVLRLLVGVSATILLSLGLALLALGVPVIPLIAGAAIGLVAAIWERTRYRSAAAERASSPPGPGGGEPDAQLEPRFRRSDEVFVDPTSGRVMRVYADPATGERRYRAEA